MKQKLSALIILFSAMIYSQNLKVMTYNIRLSLESDKENSWTNRKPETVSLINYYHPDIMGVQEAVPEQMVDLRNGLKNYASVGVGRDDGANKGEFSAVFYDAVKFQLLKGGTFWLSETPDKPSKGWDAALNRICSYALLKMKNGGKKVWVFNVHFDHVGNLARVNASKLILEKIKSFNTQNYPVILSGDFNLTEDSEPIRILSRNLNDTFYHSETPHYGSKGTFQDFDVNTPPKDRIDYIFTKGFRVLNHRTINDRRENLLYPSDHFPVFTEIQFLK